MNPAVVGWVAVGVVSATLIGFLVVHRSWPVTSPPILIASCYMVVALVGPMIVPRVSESGGVSAALALSPGESQRTTLLLLVAGLSLLLGGTAHEVSTTFRGAGPLKRRATVTLRAPVRALRLAAIPAVMLVAGVGPVYLLQKPAYLAFAGSGQMVSLGSALSLPAVALVSCVLFSTQSRKAQRLGRLLLVTYGVIFFGLASRQLPLVPLLVLIGWSLSGRRKKGTWLRVTAAACATVVLYSLPLELRKLQDHGIIPYAQHVLTHPEIVMSAELDVLANNLFFSFPLTGHVVSRELPIPSGVFWVMVNPLPGAAAGWHDIKPTQRVNPATPFNALGQLGNFGWVYVISYLAAVGWYLAHLQYTIRRRLSFRWQPMAITGVSGLSGLFAVTTLQLSLRTSSRLIYYAMAIEAITFLAITVMARPKANEGLGLETPRMSGDTRGDSEPEALPVSTSD